MESAPQAERRKQKIQAAQGEALSGLFGEVLPGKEENLNSSLH